MHHLVAQKATETAGRLVIDGDKLLRALRLPYSAIEDFRNMRIGDSHSFFDFCGSGIDHNDNFEIPSAYAVVERQRSRLAINVMCHGLPIANRKHVIGSLTVIYMKVMPNRDFLILPTCCAGDPVYQLLTIWQMVRVFRYAHRLSQMAKAQGYVGDSQFLLPEMPKSHQQLRQRVVFLDTL